MTEAADRVFLNGEVHALTDPDDTHEAVAVRDGRIVRLGRTYDVEFLAGVDTDVVDLEGRVLLPGFIDAHTHLATVGRTLVLTVTPGEACPETVPREIPFSTEIKVWEGDQQIDLDRGTSYEWGFTLVQE